MTLRDTHIQVRLTIGSILTGDEICLAGDTDHFLATMRRSSIASIIRAHNNPSRENRLLSATCVFVGHMCGCLGHICVAKNVLRKNCGTMRGDRDMSAVIDSSVYHLCSARIGRGVG